MEEINETVRALSWKQPFASLMLEGKIETRSWNTKYRGLVLICASVKPYAVQSLVEICGSELGNVLDDFQRHYDDNDGIPVGVAIAIGRLVDSRPMKREDEKKCFVEFHPDLYCHVYEDVKAIEPFKWKGSQGWRTLTEEQIKLIKFI